MSTYAVEILEILSRIVTVEAGSPEQAEKIVGSQWDERVHVLDADDFDGVSFNAIGTVEPQN